MIFHLCCRESIKDYKLKQILISMFVTLNILFASTVISKEEISSAIGSSINNHANSTYFKVIDTLYQMNEHQPFWIGTARAQQFTAMLDILQNPLYNYKNKNFNHDEIVSAAFELDSGNLVQNERIKTLADIDVMMTEGFLKLLRFVRIGDVDWNLVKEKLRRLKEEQDVHAVWEIKVKSMPSAKELYSVLSKGDISGYIYRQLPLVDRYKTLIKMLQKYRKMPKFSKLHEGRKLKIGTSDDRIAQIKRMMIFFGDLPKNTHIDSSFDRSFAKAVKHFRQRFKLTPGEFIDNKMIKYLNWTKKEYLDTIIVNLDKLKLYPHTFEKRFIEVNVPEFKMRFYENGKSIFSSDIVVGRIDRPTPIFSSRMTYMVLNPTWTIPDNLVKKDLIPMLKKHPKYLQEHNIHVFTSYKKGAQESELDMEKLFSYEHSDKPVPYRFVQYPSESNALGKVKFMFPNKYSVYLHDTDNKKLFVYRYRVFSSGCMRVEKPFDFMNLLLRYTSGNYSITKANEILESNKPTTLKLKQAIPVHIVYFTARKESGREYFFYDIYLHDQIIRESTEGNIKSTFTVPKKRLDPLRKKRKKRNFFRL